MYDLIAQKLHHTFFKDLENNKIYLSILKKNRKNEGNFVFRNKIFFTPE